MTNHIQTSAFNLEQSQVLNVTTSVTIENEDKIVQSVVDAKTVTLPATPQEGQTHRIMSKSAVTTTVAAAGGHAITVTSVAASTFRDYTFLRVPGTATGEWISQALS